jgi:hypothetical protein
LVAGAVTVPFWDVSASTLEDVTRSVADATDVKFANAVVHVVAYAIDIVVSLARTTASAECIQDVTITVASSIGNASPSANVAFVQLQTRTIVKVGRRIVIASRVVCAST